MATIPTERVATLPKWARELIADIQRERDMAVRALNEYVDSQTPSKFSVDDWVCTGETIGPATKVRYIQTEAVKVEHAGVELNVYAHKDDHIAIQWNTIDQRCDVAFVPESYQRARLVHKTKMD